jgi:hypothetical protein
MARKCFYCGVSEDASAEEKEAALLSFEVVHLFAITEEDERKLQEYKARRAETPPQRKRRGT